ncbi:RluA family pseudouridine synthase [Candidatus Desantisbacteria bacterium]|nr:RluA family pseudouridine synthase [Candidatus Desantisbacteria bacterium]
MKIFVSDNDANQRIDTFLASHLKVSRAFVQRMIDEGRVTRETLQRNIPIKAHYRVKKGDCLSVELPEEKESSIVPESLPLDILYEDSLIIVVNKPAGMITHPTHRITTNTLVNALSAHTNLCQIGLPLRPGIVHRLDKETSGVIVVAKTDKAYWQLTTQFHDRKTYKEYLALVHGYVQNDEGTIDEPIGRPRKGGTGMQIRGRLSRPAITSYYVEKRINQEYTLLKVRIYTGRTHQIRLHLKSIGHPVVGDKRYGNQKPSARGATSFARQALHAHILGISHPETGEYMQFIAPLPEDMESMIR